MVLLYTTALLNSQIGLVGRLVFLNSSSDGISDYDSNESFILIHLFKYFNVAIVTANFTVTCMAGY